MCIKIRQGRRSSSKLFLRNESFRSAHQQPAAAFTPRILTGFFPSQSYSPANQATKQYTTIFSPLLRSATPALMYLDCHPKPRGSASQCTPIAGYPNVLLTRQSFPNRRQSIFSGAQRAPPQLFLSAVTRFLLFRKCWRLRFAIASRKLS